MYSFVYLIVILVTIHMTISYIYRKKFVYIPLKTTTGIPYMKIPSLKNHITPLKSKASRNNKIVAVDSMGNFYSKIIFPLVKIKDTNSKCGLYVKEK